MPPEESADAFDARLYWESRLRRTPDLRGTGHRQFSISYNAAMYQVATERLLAALAAAHIDVRGARILDVGAGLGYFVNQYTDWGAAHITGLDIAEISVTDLRRSFPQHEFVQVDISTEVLALPTDYDLVSAISVLFHIVDDRRFERAVDNMCVRVKPGGHLIMVDAFREPLLPTARHTRLRPLRHYLPILDRHAFRVLTIRPMYYLMGRGLIPFLGPRVLSWRPILNLLLKLEYSLDSRLRSNLDGPKFLIAARQQASASRDQPAAAHR